MSIKEKLVGLREQKNAETIKETITRKTGETNLKETRDILVAQVCTIAQEQLVPILNELNNDLLNNIGEISIISNEKGFRKKGEDWNFAATARIVWDTGQDKNHSWGNGIGITIGSNYLLKVSKAVHSETCGPLSPQLLTRKVVTSWGKYPPYQSNPYTTPTEEIPNSRPNIHQDGWKDRVETDIAELYEAGQYKYDQHVFQDFDSLHG